MNDQHSIPEVLPLIEKIHEKIRILMEDYHKGYHVTQIYGDARSTFKALPIRHMEKQQTYTLLQTDYTCRVEMINEQASERERLSVRIIVIRNGQVAIEQEDFSPLRKM